MTSPWHPSDEQLRRFITIEDDSDDNQVVADHLNHCSSCLERLEQLDQARELITLNMGEEGSIEVPYSIVERVSREVDSDNLPRSYKHLSSSQTLEYLDFLDNGGMGDVLVYRDTVLDRKVVLKTLRHDKEQSIQKINRFAQEKRIVSQLRLPGVPEVYGSGYLPDGREYFCMQYIEGGKLSDHIRSFHTSHPPLRRSNEHFLAMLRIFVTICRTMDSAHTQRVVHRDLKSSNVLLGKNKFPYVIDWGLAGELHSNDLDESVSGSKSPRLTHQGLRLGTPYSWSPEQAAGNIDLLDDLTDIYGLGSILFELLTGTLLHAPLTDRSTSSATESKSDAEQKEEIERITHELKSGVVRDPRAVNGSIPNELASICIRATQPIREKRYPSAGKLADDIDAWIACLPVDAHQYNPIEQMQRWIGASPSRATAIFASISLIGILAIAFSTISYSLKQAAEQNERRAQSVIRDSLTTLRSVLDIASDNRRPDTDELRSIQRQMVAAIEAGIDKSMHNAFDKSTVIETAILMGKLGDIHSDNAQQHEAERVLTAACDLIHTIPLEQIQSNVDITLIYAELHTKLAVSQIRGRHQDLAAMTLARGLKILDKIPEDQLEKRGKLSRSIYMRRTYAVALFRNWELGTLDAHDEAVEILKRCNAVLARWPNDEQTLLEKAELLAFIGLCVHKSGKFTQEMLRRYQDRSNSEQLFDVAQAYFGDAIACLEKIPQSSRDTDEYSRVFVSVLSKKSLSDVRISPAHAQATCDKYIALLRQNVAKYPFSRERRIDLASALGDYADKFFPDISDVTLNARKEGLDLLAEFSDSNYPRLMNCLTLLTTRHARDLFTLGRKEEANQLVLGIFQRYGTLHHGEPLDSELLGYALIHRLASEKGDSDLQEKTVHHTLIYLSEFSSEEFMRNGMVQTMLSTIPECKELAMQVPIRDKLSSLGFSLGEQTSPAK